MLKTVLFIFLIHSGYSLAKQYYDRHCNTLNCMSKDQYITEIKSLKSQLASHDPYQNPEFWKQFRKPSTVKVPQLAGRNALLSQLDSSRLTTTMQPQQTTTPPDDTCTICHSKPCLNGGVCIPDEINPFTNYTCVCPWNYNGHDCENELICEANTCGANATCSINNNQINCVCNRGLSGNPWEGCSLVAKTTCLETDPHYTTFDGLYYDYMGTCPYKFSTPCTGSFSGDYSSFTVRVRNALHSPNASVSWVSEVEVDMYNQTVHIQYPTRKIFFNKQLIKTPYRWPNVSSVLISIDYDGSKFSVTNADTVQVTFDQANACLRVPDIPEFQGNQTLCGSAGNLDGNPYDDIADINGTYLVNYNDTDTMLKMIDTWRVPLNEWLYEAPYDDISCMSGYDMRGANQCREQQTQAQQMCLPIRQASGGTGIFAACKDMGPGVIQKYYDDCVMDVCSDETFLCAEFGQFYSRCQALLPDTDIPDWREDTNCHMSCPVNSHYSACKSSCPATCNDHSSTKCDQGCSDGCTCNPNYVMDMTHLEQLTCILVTECGCTDEFGQPHSAHDVWLTDSCQLYNYCSNGTHIEKPSHCGTNAHCDILGGVMTCVCDQGYQGDGYNCTDINECLDQSVCGQQEGHGRCNNFPGGHNCSCYDWFNGTNCQTYNPRRHCSDLQLYDGQTNSGVYSIFPYGPNAASIDVICDMDSQGGGWTIVSQVADNNPTFFSGKAMQDYKSGFGSARDGSVWLGLDNLYRVTSIVSMSLKVNVEQCSTTSNGTLDSYCIYPKFSIDGQTRAIIPQKCSGTFESPQDPWAVWDLTLPGPVFSSPDNDTTGACTEYFQNTGFWFYKRSAIDLCGPANLNGVRYSCTNLPSPNDLPTYLRFNSNPVSNARMAIRPTQYPNYDVFKPPVSTTPSP